MQSHKSLRAWQEANGLVLAVMTEVRGVRHPCIDQLQRAALSIQLNIAEGYAMKSSKRFRNHLDIAYASAVETADLLELSSQIGLIPSDVANEAMGKCVKSQQLLRGLIKRLRKEQ